MKTYYIQTPLNNPLQVFFLILFCQLPRTDHITQTKKTEIPVN